MLSFSQFNSQKKIIRIAHHIKVSTVIDHKCDILKISSPKTVSFQIKILKIFFIFLLKNIYCGYSLEPPRRGGSNEYPQYMFFNRNQTDNVYPCKPRFYYIKVGFKGVKII